MIAGVFYRGSVQSALLGLSLASSMRLARTVNYVVRLFTQLESEMTSVERLLHLADLPIEEHKYDTDTVSWPPSDGSLRFDAVTMRYRPGLPLVLRDVTFEVPHGTKLGICGRTGKNSTQPWVHQAAADKILCKLPGCLCGRLWEKLFDSGHVPTCPNRVRISSHSRGGYRNTRGRRSAGSPLDLRSGMPPPPKLCPIAFSVLQLRMTPADGASRTLSSFPAQSVVI